MSRNFQHIYDALKKVKDEGEAWVTWDGERLRLVGIKWEKVPGCGGVEWDVPMLPEGLTVPGCYLQENTRCLESSVFDAVVRAVRKPGGVAQATCNSYKDCGSRIRLIEGRTNRMIGWDDVLAVIVERHPREA